MHFPVELKFKIAALSPQISVIDGNGQLQLYVKQKLFKLKESVKVYADAGQSQLLYEINADRVIDFSAKYHFIDANGIEIGSVKRKGRRSLWKAHYEIYDENGLVVSEIHEENGWVKVLDGIFGELPVIGILSGYIFNPSYAVSHAISGNTVVRVTKKPALFESSFVIEEAVDISEAAEIRTILAILMMTLLERSRG